MSKFERISDGHVPTGAGRADGLRSGRAPKSKRSHSGLLSVIGADGRARVTDTRLAPWRMICALRISSASGAVDIGTGWLIGPRTVLTAGHCLLGRRGDWAVSAEVIPGRDGDARPFGALVVPRDRMEVHPRWSSDRLLDRDVGVLHLPDALGESTGWFATAMPRDDEIEGLLVNVAGYPFRAGVDTRPGRAPAGRQLWWHADAIERAGAARIHYATDTSGGQSGGPVWTYEGDDGAPIGIAVHAYGAEAVRGPGGLHVPRANSAPRIDADLGQHISDWIARSAGMADVDMPPPAAMAAPAPAAPTVPPAAPPPAISGGPEGPRGPRTEAELLAMVSDPDVPWASIAPHLVPDESRSEPFAPAFRMAPVPGQPQPEGSRWLDWLNAAVRLRRQAQYRRDARERPGDLRLVSDGDSWFLHPLITETWGALRPSHLVYSLDGAGDLLSDMAGAREAVEQARANAAQGVLLSGGGNDLLAGGALAEVLAAGDGVRVESHLDEALYAERVEEMAEHFRGYVGAILASDPALHVFVHGYDRPRPMAGGKWLERPMRGHVPEALQAPLVGLMIDRFNDAMIDLAAELGPRVHHVDMRGAAPHPWFDEIHPSDAGFAAVGARLDAAIRAALGARRPAGEVALAAAGPAPLAPLAAHLSRPVDEAAEAPARRRYLARMAEAGRDVIAHRAVDPARPRPEAAPLAPGRERVILPPLPGTDGPATEVVLGEPDFLAARFLRDGARFATAICRVRLPNGSGTGSLLRGDLVLTNHHVLPSAAVAASARAEFGFEEGGELREVRLDPSRLFLADEGRDFAIVACDPASLAAAGLDEAARLTLPLAPSGIVPQAPVNIVQHPAGRPKEVALRDNRVISVLSGTLRYRTDTEGGSSGAPVFDDAWRLVGLHRAGLDGAYNQAVRIEAISGFLDARLAAGDAPAPGLLRRALGGTAPELGFFGRAGAVRESRPEVELPDFAGDGAIADIGFWSAGDALGEPGGARMEDVADILTRLNMDVMGLAEVSEGPVHAAAERMNAAGGNVGVLVAGAGGRRGHALLFDRDTARVRPMEEVAARHADLLEETMDGRPVLPRAPLVAHVEIGAARLAVIVAHLGSGSGRDGPASERRRRRAARILGAVVDRLRAEEGLPVAACGDLGAWVETDAPGHATLTAERREAGAITLLNPRGAALVDRVIAAGDLRVAGMEDDDMAIERIDRRAADLSEGVSEHVPLAVRVVMRDEPLERPGAGGPRDRGGIDIPEGASEVRVSFE